jgi:hypothetical protein
VEFVAHDLIRWEFGEKPPPKGRRFLFPIILLRRYSGLYFFGKGASADLFSNPSKWAASTISRLSRTYLEFDPTADQGP